MATEAAVSGASHRDFDVAATKAALRSSSTTTRISHLHTIDEKIAGRGLDGFLPDLLPLLFATHSLFHDRESRRAVQKCISTILAAQPKPDTLAPFVAAIRQEAQKPGIAPTSAFVLVEWCCLLLQHFTQVPLWEKFGVQVILSNADALERCTQPDSRPTVAHGALVITRRGLRALFNDDRVREKAIPESVQALTTKSTQPLAKNAVFLGAIAGVCARISKAKPILEQMKDAYTNFYVKEIIGSKIPLPSHLSSGLADYFTSFVSVQAFENDIVPPLEKGLLRAPEVVLDLIPPLVESLQEYYDLSRSLKNHLLKPLLSNVKSTNPAIRASAAKAFKSIAEMCRDLSVMEPVADEIIQPLKTGKLTSADHRALHSELLQSLPLSDPVARKICAALPAVAAKEGNEAALGAETAALVPSAIYILDSNTPLDKAVLDAFAKGIADKKVATRKVWLLRTGDILYSFRAASPTPPSVIGFAEAVLPSLMAVWTEVLANPLTAAQNGLIVGAYVLSSLSSTILQNLEGAAAKASVKKAAIPKTALTLQPKPSFLLNPRLYTKLTAEEDLHWFSRALGGVAGDLSGTDVDPLVREAWAHGFIYLISASGIKYSVPKEACQLLSSLYASQPAVVSDAVISGLWSWLEGSELGDKESPAVLSKWEPEHLHLVLKSICLSQDEYCKLGSGRTEEQLERQMCSLLVLARPDLVPKTSWIDLCLRVGLDPGTLARKYEPELLQQIVQKTSPDERSSVAKQAAYNAATDLAFVAPDTIIPRIVSLIKEDMDVGQLSGIGPVEAAIYRTPEGTAFVDVLAKKQNVVPDKNTKNYDLLKWEEELRAQIAAKKGQPRKLTAEETAKVNAQLKKESEIRAKVGKVVARLLRGIGIIHSLVSGPPTDASPWMGTAVDALLAVIDAGGCNITGDAAPMAYIALSEKVAHRLGPMRQFIGVATLRAHEASSLPDNLKEEPFEELVTRVLYKIRFTGEQRPFDTVSVLYMLPLVFLVLGTGGYGEVADDRDAQLVLAIEFLAVHSDACADEAIPRAKLLEVLISCLQRYSQHYKILRDCFADVVRCIAPGITSSEISILVKGAIVPEQAVRTTVLQSISAEVDLSDLDFCEEIWLASHDEEDENADLGREIWEESEMKLSPEVPRLILPYVYKKDEKLRGAAARALASACKAYPETIDGVLVELRSSYVELAKPRVPQLDEFGMPKKMDLSDPWEARHGTALAFKELAPLLQKGQIDDYFQFVIDQGPLADQDDRVRDKMLDAAIHAIDVKGKAIVGKLMRTFERTLESTDKNSREADRVNEAVVIMYGALGRHLAEGDAKIPVVIERLLETLNTPSETVQFAIAECLPPLIRACGDKSSKYFEQIMETLLTSKNYGRQRGAAYGLAGLVSGRGIYVLKEYRIISSLKSASENKKDSSQREAAYLAYELLSTMLGRLFEPYVIQIVPQLLTGFGDANANVRDACLAAAKACFARLSSFGVKKILPTLLEGLEDQQWRSKKGACDLLGAMAYLDPQQLAQSLPDIIPPLTGVLNDSHKEVRAAANKSLKRFGEVISNPEIKGLVDILLKALSDPTKYTDETLDQLIKVQFVHYLDAPSLALVTRILQRGLGDRSNTKRKASQVIGSLAHLTERKDLVFHLPVLVAGLKVAVVDPVPTTRATASRALGSLVEKLGEDALPDLIPGLMQTLKSDTGAGDRLGSAQALSEVLAGLGTTRLEETLPTILQNVQSAKPAVREGFMSLFIFLPVCFGNSFANYLGKIIPPILAGLADDVESIRETALRAGRLLVKNFAVRAVDLLLPELERGLADDSYRIRLSSVELVGDLLFNLTGIKASDEEAGEAEAEMSAKEAGASLREVLGEEKRNRILSALYICRCDTAGAVRTAAVTVWKALVSSPRTLRELTPTLTQLIIRRLGSSNMEHKVIASNALGELIRKAGDGVLASLLPTLEESLQTSSDTDAKQGICLALKELISSASSEALEDHEKTLISVVRTALTDSDEEVREAAAEAFDSLQQILGKKAVDQVLPYLLNLLRSHEDADNALQALLTLLTETTRSNMILPNLIPTLTASPISSFNAKALASLSKVAGPAMNRRLPGIINALMDNIIACKDAELREELDQSFDAVILSIDEFDGLNTVMNVLLQLMKHEDHRRRASTAMHLGNFFARADVDYSRYNQDIIRAMLLAFEDRDMEVVKAAWAALNEFTKRLRKEEMDGLVIPTRQTLLQVGVAGTNLAGFELPKGINAILPIFLQGLMNGTPEQRTQAALAISDIVDRTSEESLKPFVTQITGPLIRVVSERSTEVRAAILLTLNNLLEKMPTALRPFLPQLQRTFAKSLADTTSEVLRTRAAKALGTLIKFTPRVDPLITELVTGSKTSDAGVRTAMLKALYEVISKAGANMGETSRQAVLGLIDMDTDERDTAMTVTNAKLLGALIKNVPTDAAQSLFRNRVLTTAFSNSSVLALNAVLLESPDALLGSSLADDLPELLCQGITSKNPFIAENFILATGKYLLVTSPTAPVTLRTTSYKPPSFESLRKIFTSIAHVIQPGQPVDSRRLALVLVRTLARGDNSGTNSPPLVRPHLALLAPPVFAGVRDPVIPVKLAAEQAFIALFDVADSESRIFDKFIASDAGREAFSGVPGGKRVVQDYFKRVALRLGAQARERREAEGGAGGLGLANDEAEDEREIWSVGKVEVESEGDGGLFGGADA